MGCGSSSRAVKDFEITCPKEGFIVLKIQHDNGKLF